MTVKAIERIRQDISRNPTRIVSGWKVSMTRQYTLKICVYDLQFDQCEALLVEQQQ